MSPPRGAAAVIIAITVTALASAAGTGIADALASSAADSPVVHVDTAGAGGRLPPISPLFAGFTDDWWTQNDTHDGARFGRAGMLTLDLQSPALRQLVSARAPALWRVGGTPAGSVVYDVGGNSECGVDGEPPPATCATTPLVYRKFACPLTSSKAGAPTAATCGQARDPHGNPCCWDPSPIMHHPSCYIVRTPECLTMARWREILLFANDTGISLVFGLNGLHHRTNQSVRLNLTNAVQLLEYTASQPELRNLLHGVELSNEVGGKGPAGPHGSGRLSAGVRGGGLVNADVLAADFVALSAHLDRVWGALPAGSQQPKLLGPDCGLTETQGVTPETQEGSWWQVFLARAGHVLDGITYHTYTYGSTTDPTIFDHMLEPGKLDQIADFATAALSIAKAAGINLTKTPVIAGEMGPISGGGQNGTSNRFIDVFWYLEALGKQASLGVHAFARSTLTGGFYEQLDHTKGFRPNPDYWAGLEWARSMGTQPLAVSVLGGGGIRAHAHCGSMAGEITLLLMNPTANATLASVAELAIRAVASYRAGAGGLHSSDVEALGANKQWKLLQYDLVGAGAVALPPPVPARGDTVAMPAYSYAFVTCGGVGLCIA